MLTHRQNWVLAYLRDWGRACSAIWFYDDGMRFLSSYARQFGINSNDPLKVQRSLYRVLNDLSAIGLVETQHGSNYGMAGYGACPPSHCNEYKITRRGSNSILEYQLNP